MKSVLIVDDHPSIRMAMKILLENEGFSQISEADNGIQAINLLKKNPFDLLILDIGIPNMDGMTVLKAFKQADIPTKTLVYTSQSGDVYAARCMSAGAEGFISKNDPLDVVITAIKVIFSGYTFYPSQSNYVFEESIALKKLSNRELDVLRQMASGMKNHEIAINMCLSDKTISTYKTRMMEKLQVTTFVDLLAVAKRGNLL